MIEFSEADDENIVTCSICEHPYDQIRLPKLLSSCGHTFCTECTQSLTSPSSTIKCPKCRRETDVNGTSLLTNFQLLEVIVAKNEANSKKANKPASVCIECENQITFQNGRCCKTCDVIYPSVLCLNCCVEKHNGHELLSIAKLYGERCQELSNVADKYEKSMELLRTEIEKQHNDIALRSAKIQSLAQAHSHSYKQEVASFVFNESSIAAEPEIDFEKLAEKETFLWTLFASAESTMKEVAELNAQILSLETAAIRVLSVAMDENDDDVPMDENYGEPPSTRSEMIEALVGKWKLVESENFNEYLKVIGVGLVTRTLNGTVNANAFLELAVSDGKWSITLETYFKTATIEFELDQEFDETTLGGREMKSTFTLTPDGKLVQQQQKVKDDDKDSILTRYVEGNELVAIYESQGVTAKRIYKKIKDIEMEKTSKSKSRF